MNMIARGLLIPILLWAVFCSHVTAQTTTNVWKVVRSGIRQNLSDIVFGEGLFVAVGDSATIITSPNGRDWAVRSFQTNGLSDYTGIAYGNGVFVAVGPGKHKVRMSENGLDWGAPERGSFALYDIAFGEGRFVAVGDAILTSVDGRSWTRIRPISTSKAIAYGNSRFVALGENDRVWVSGNGRRWTNYLVEVPGTFKDIVFNGNVFIAAEEDVTADRIWTSSDGVTWSPSAPTSFIVNGLARARSNVIVAVGEDPAATLPGRIHVSPDGLGWPGEPATAPRPLNAAAYGRGWIVAVGQGGLIRRAVLDQIDLSP
jgi:hypothetical protein